MWYPRGFAPESFLCIRPAAVLALAAFAALGAAGCGPNGGALATYNIVFAFTESPDHLKRLDFTVDFTGGSFLGSSSSVTCSLVTPNSGETGTFTLNTATELLASITATVAHPLVASGESIVTCQFSATTQPTSANFTVKTTLATVAAPGTTPATAPITVTVASTNVATAAVASSGEASE